MKKHIIESLEFFKNEVSELYLPKEIPKINEIPEPLTFYRNWVAPNIPVLIKGGIKNWPALKKWNEEYFCKIFGQKKISVAVTPNGYADSVTKYVINKKTVELFVLPEERVITIKEFYSKLNYKSSQSGSKAKQSKGVFYIQKQNSNLSEEFPELLPDINENLLWASETFQSKPSAINLWIGDERAITSLHKDPFENIYCVISGHKDFILLPPTDRPWLPVKEFSVGQYVETSPGVFEINVFDSDNWMSKTSRSDVVGENASENTKVPWIVIDPSNPDYKQYPLYKNASPVKVRVEEGDALYLPSLWFHYVKQSHKCIAVNYWYDMQLDIKFAYFQLLEKLTNLYENVDS